MQCADAGSFAILDVVFQAYAELVRLYVFGSQCQVAGAERIEPFDKFEHGLHGREVRVGTEVSRAVPHNLPSLEYPREVFVAYANGRVAFVVFQQNVIAGLVFLDKVVL